MSDLKHTQPCQQSSSSCQVHCPPGVLTLCMSRAALVMQDADALEHGHQSLEGAPGGVGAPTPWGPPLVLLSGAPSAASHSLTLGKQLNLDRSRVMPWLFNAELSAWHRTLPSPLLSESLLYLLQHPQQCLKCSWTKRNDVWLCRGCRCCFLC